MTALSRASKAFTRPDGSRHERLAISEIVETYDPLDLDTTSRLSSKVPHDMRVHRYELVDTTLLRAGPFKIPITRINTLRLSGMYLCLIDDRFATRIEICGDGLDRYCFSVPLKGAMELTQSNDRRASASGSHGLVIRGTPGTRLHTSDGASRMNLWIEARALVSTLEEILGGRLSKPLEFKIEVDWTAGLANALRTQMQYLSTVMMRSNGAPGTGLVSTASFADQLIRSVLHTLPHNYTERMSRLPSDVVPSHVKRAEAFMRAHSTQSIGMTDVAAAAGCSTRSLSLAFNRFRDTTPLSALQAIRLDQVRELLMARAEAITIAEAARRFQFNDLSRFRNAYFRRYAELPSTTVAGPEFMLPIDPDTD